MVKLDEITQDKAEDGILVNFDENYYDIDLYDRVENMDKTVDIKFKAASPSGQQPNNDKKISVKQVVSTGVSAGASGKDVTTKYLLVYFDKDLSQGTIVKPSNVKLDPVSGNTVSAKVDGVGFDEACQMPNRLVISLKDVTKDEEVIVNFKDLILKDGYEILPNIKKVAIYKSLASAQQNTSSGLNGLIAPLAGTGSTKSAVKSDV